MTIPKPLSVSRLCGCISSTQSRRIARTRNGPSRSRARAPVHRERGGDQESRWTTCSTSAHLPSHTPLRAPCPASARGERSASRVYIGSRYVAVNPAAHQCHRVPWSYDFDEDGHPRRRVGDATLGGNLAPTQADGGDRGPADA